MGAVARTQEEIGAKEFDQIRRILKERTGIAIGDDKQILVRSRIQKRLRALRLSTFAEYVQYLELHGSKGELDNMVDVLTTNLTSFFRETRHFDHMREHLIPAWTRLQELRIWCAGCSSGQEPYSYAMHIADNSSAEQLGRTRILATDICRDVLATAREGVYSDKQASGISPDQLKRYFQSVPPKQYSARQNIRRPISFARLNLMERWPMTGSFHLISCRNVMIYFNPETRHKLEQRFRTMIARDGILFLGHSESLTPGSKGFEMLEPSVYRRVE